MARVCTCASDVCHLEMRLIIVLEGFTVLQSDLAV
jgi:hypothetical protein